MKEIKYKNADELGNALMDFAEENSTYEIFVEAVQRLSMAIAKAEKDILVLDDRKVGMN